MINSGLIILKRSLIMSSKSMGYNEKLLEDYKAEFIMPDVLVGVN